MQNFKSYLQEEDSNAFHIAQLKLSYTIRDIKFADELATNYIKQIKQQVKDELDLDIQLNMQSILACQFIIDLKDKYLTSDIEANVENKVRRIIENFLPLPGVMLFLEQDCNVELFVHNKLPEHIKLEYPRIYVTLKTPPVSLKGLDKLFGKFKWIQFRNFTLASDSILGLFKLNKPPMQRIALLYSNIEWIKIVSKHIDGDNDILECQEELISNGYKQYAKL